MLWTIKTGICKHHILDARGNAVGSIHRRGSSFEVRNFSGECVLRMVETAPQRVRIIGEGLDGHGEIHLSEHSSFTRPPMAIQTTVASKEGIFSVTQSPAREFSVFSGNREIGQITGMHHTAKICTATDHTMEFAALLYLLAHRMYHADDIDIV